jgi:hypothetical protein
LAGREPCELLLVIPKLLVLRSVLIVVLLRVGIIRLPMNNVV